MRKTLVWVVSGMTIVAVLGFGGYRLYKRYSAPVLGVSTEDAGRTHVTDISQVQYTSNPPTSGSHFPVWAKKGVYDRVLSDGYLIHSLEHGYVVISYDCTKQLATSYWPLATRIFAHEGEDNIPAGEPHPSNEATGSAEATGSGQPLTRMTVGLDGKMTAFTPENAPTAEVGLPEAFGSAECKQLVGQLTEFYNNNQSRRLIVVPRVGMDTPIALTAWGRILKLDEWDEKVAAQFVGDWENKGPEKTIE